jgi:predicted LPLAT superfamily acyltransferase
VRLPRAGRDAALAEWAQHFAHRLAWYARFAPYNWFNFYDYWAPRAAPTTREMQ